MRILSFLTTSAVLSTSFKQVNSHAKVPGSNQDDASTSHLRGITSGADFHDNPRAAIFKTYYGGHGWMCDYDWRESPIHCVDDGLVCRSFPDYLDHGHCIYDKENVKWCVNYGQECAVFGGQTADECCSGFECQFDDNHHQHASCQPCSDGNLGEECREDRSCCGDAKCVYFPSGSRCMWGENAVKTGPVEERQSA
ncbi:hypothetical protein ACHAWF_015580 [Thalassiosira exigua]